jgi:hypothetical protein
MSERETLIMEPYQGDKPILEWTERQRRVGLPWAVHEVGSRKEDPTCDRYPWIPSWTTLTEDQIIDQFKDWLRAPVARKAAPVDEVGALREQDEWTSHPKYVREDWVAEVTTGDTQLGYWEWVSHSLEAEKLGEE